MLLFFKGVRTLFPCSARLRVSDLWGELINRVMGRTEAVRGEMYL